MQTTMTVNRISKLLWEHIPEFAPRTLDGVQIIQGNSFCLSDGALSAFLRWIPNGDWRGETELRYYRTILSTADLPTPRMLAAVRTAEGTLAVWQWLEGSDLRQEHRSLLPAAFTLLGRFHLSQKHSGPVESPVTHREYATSHELLDAELDADLKARHRCQQILATLEAGLQTVNHGDVHPGNIILAGNRLYFVDWGYAHRGLGLTDLAYLWDTRIHGGCPDDWWVISEMEASNSLSAYLSASGEEDIDQSEVARAVMVWNQLCTHLNAVRNGLEVEVERSKKLIF